jgi:pimeloyl-ACP methyl ester carboxylesterase
VGTLKKTQIDFELGSGHLSKLNIQITFPMKKGKTVYFFFLLPMIISAQSTTDQKNFISSYSDVNGLKMYYEIHGEGFPLVLIHGGGSTIESTFGRILPELAKNHKVIAVEMQAHGRTKDIDRPLSFIQDADDISVLLKNLGIPKADIFGFSNGASTTLQMAIRHPEQVNKIVVASTFSKKSGAPGWFWEMMSKPTFEQMPKLLKEAYLKVNPDTAGLMKMYHRDVARMQSFPDIKDEDLKNIKSPALIICGDKDVVTPEHAVEMSKLIPNAQLAIFPGGHGDYLGEITTAFNSAVVQGTAAVVEKFLQ